MAPLLYRLARTALFRLDAETSHELAIESFRRFPALSTAPFAGSAVSDPFTWQGLTFANRVGLAAGLDKNGECLRAWSRLGFGFVEIGTVTPRAQPGNPRPRMFRLTGHEAIINRLGFNNRGVEHLLREVREAEFRGVLGINIGKNADTPIERAHEDYTLCLRKVYAQASYVTVNISSPNTKNLRALQDGQKLDELLAHLCRERTDLEQQHGRRVPMLVKIAPDVDDTQIESLGRAALEHGVDGLIATNTTITRTGVDGHRHAGETGGLSGRPLRPLSESVVRRLRTAVGRNFLLVGVGGIVSGDDAVARVAAGADLVQVYTGFIYRGPALVGECARALKASPRAGTVTDSSHP